MRSTGSGSFSKDLEQNKLLIKRTLNQGTVSDVVLLFEEVLRDNLIWTSAIDAMQDLVTELSSTSTDHDDYFNILNRLQEMVDDAGYVAHKQLDYSCYQLLAYYLENKPNDFYQKLKEVIKARGFDRLKYICIPLIHNHDNLKELLEAISKLKVDEKIHLLNEVMSQAGDERDLYVLLAVKQRFPDYFRDYAGDTGFVTALDLLEKLEPVLLEVDDPEKRALLLGMYCQFAEDFGLADQQGGEMLLAAKFANKDVASPPLVIDGSDFSELQGVFQLLASAPTPLRQRFVVSGGHWVTCDVRVDESNHCFIYVIDPLGKDQALSMIELDQIVDAVDEFFPNKVTIYLADEKRQNSTAGCSIFALDDVSHLFSLEKYLDAVEYQDGLFDYCEKNKSDVVRVRDSDVFITKLPLHLLRTMQSSRLIALMEKGAPGEEVLNRKSMTPTLFAEQRPDMREICPGRWRNERLEAKRLKMAERVKDFICAHSVAEIQDAVRVHTLEGFAERLGLQEAKQSTRPQG